MKFLIQLDSRNWWRNLDSAPGALEHLITMKTAECEGIEAAGALLDRAAIARVDAVEPIAGSHNVKAVVDAGRYGIRTVVCGAPNCRVGMFTAFVPVGNKVVDGIESQGMLASGAELGINHDHTGRHRTRRPGRRNRCQAVCRIRSSKSITKSITHRPDLWGHHGMAARSGRHCGPQTEGPGEAERAAAERGRRPSKSRLRASTCARATARWCWRTSKTRPSPYWLQYRLEAIGLNSISKHRGHDELHHGRVAAAHARVSMPICWRAIPIYIRPARGRRTAGGSERRRVPARSLEPGDLRMLRDPSRSRA